MPGASEIPRLVVEVERRGKLLSGEPYFTPGVPLVLETKGAGSLRRGDLALVQPGRGRARVVRRLGSAGRIEDVLEALLAEQGARVEFEPYELPAGGGEGRVDLRDLPAVTIDPEGAKDFDDALSFRREDGGIRAYVHIADVSYFVRPGTPLDLGAAERAFSTYVPGLVAPMLPPELADDACSLRPHQDRFCVTVELPPSGEPSFYRSLICSRARLTYGEAQRRDAPPGDPRAARPGGRARDRPPGGALPHAARSSSPRRRSSSPSPTGGSPTRGGRASTTRTFSSRS